MQYLNLKESDYLIGVFKDIKADYPFPEWQVTARKKRAEQSLIINLRNEHYEKYESKLCSLDVEIIEAKRKLDQLILQQVNLQKIEAQAAYLLQRKINSILKS
jgi:hypothetical protein